MVKRKESRAHTSDRRFEPAKHGGDYRVELERPPEKERVISFKHRIVEVLVTSMLAAIASSLSVTWSVSAAFTHSKEQLNIVAAKQVDDEVQIKENAKVNADQNTQLAVIQQNNLEVVRRLGSIETKIDVQSASLNRR